MARVGVSYPLYCLLDQEDGYDLFDPSTIGWLGKATSFDITVDNADANKLYADNRLQETDNTFGGGTLTIGIDDLRDDAALAILGLTKVGSAAPYELVHKAGTSAPYCAVGGVIKQIQSGVTKYTAVFLPKVQFSDPGISVSTQGESIEWQTPEITATILMMNYGDDYTEHSKGWITTIGGFNSEYEAYVYIATTCMGATNPPTPLN